LCIEPLNRFETYFLNTQEDAARFIDQIGHIKDEDSPGHSVVLGKGKGNIGEFLRTIARDSFQNLCAIEYEEGD
jgi:sugar phosphate isomerase/epimerase